MFVLDSNIVSDVLSGDVSLKRKVQEYEQHEVTMCIAAITACELYKGACLAKGNVQQKTAAVDAFLKDFVVLPLDEKAGKEFGRTYAQLQRKGKLTGEFDLLIAATAKANNMIVVTRNEKDFKHTGVQLEIW